MVTYKLMKYKSKETYYIYFEFSSDTRTTKCMLKQNIFSLLWYPLIEPIEGGNTLSVIRCSFVVQRRSRMGDSRASSLFAIYASGSPPRRGRMSKTPI